MACKGSGVQIPSAPQIERERLRCSRFLLLVSRLADLVRREPRFSFAERALLFRLLFVGDGQLLCIDTSWSMPCGLVQIPSAPQIERVSPRGFESYSASKPLPSSGFQEFASLVMDAGRTFGGAGFEDSGSNPLSSTNRAGTPLAFLGSLLRNSWFKMSSPCRASKPLPVSGC